VVVSLAQATAQAQTAPTPTTAPSQTAKPAKSSVMLPAVTVVSRRARKPVTRPVQTARPTAPASAPVETPAQAVAAGAPDVASGPTPPPAMASQTTVSGNDLNTRPVTRPGEVLEAVPGLIVTQHSGDGKANQYFLRGYNLDHGTDMAIWVDDMPINMRTHAHGQGYSDLNFLMPETINSLDVRKGPYFADEGDFGSAGNLHIGLLDRTDKKTAQ